MKVPYPEIRLQKLLSRHCCTQSLITKWWKLCRVLKLPNDHLRSSLAVLRKINIWLGRSEGVLKFLAVLFLVEYFCPTVEFGVLSVLQFS